MNHKILIIDDQIEIINYIVDCFTNAEPNYIFYHAIDGYSGIDVAEKFTPDLIITDWEMPGLSGIETIERLKESEITKHIPVILCTGIMTSSQNLKTAFEAGAIDFIRKPVDPIELISRIRSMLALSDSYKKITDLNATKDKFLSIIAHDLRSPFNSILGFGNLMISRLQKNNDLESLKFIEIIRVVAQNTYKLLENLLDWARIQTGKIEFKPDKINLKLAIIDLIEQFKIESLAKNIQVNYTINENIQVFADVSMINLILRNLITNAIKFTHRNGIVEIIAKQIDNRVEISVVDNGIGMDQLMIDKLFKISEKIATSGTEKEKGTGLGLILCKEFVEMNGGVIRVESEQGKGSAFIFTVPIS